MKQVTIDLFTFEELNEKAKERAISEHMNFLIEIEEDEEIISKEYAINNIIANEYLFFENGKLANVVYYVGNHEKAGITEFNLFGNIYII